MTALLALVAMAGYQHRDKLAEMLGRVGGGAGPQPNPAEAGRAGGQAGGLAGALGGGGIGGVLSGGIRDLVDRFREVGQGEAAESWVRQGPNREIAASQLEQAIGPETLETLSRQIGLSREEILSRLSRDLPDAVDRYTPDGRIPDEEPTRPS